MEGIASNHININQQSVISPQANTGHPPEGASTPSGTFSSSRTPENSASENAAPKRKRIGPANVLRPNYREIARKCGRISYLEAADYAGVRVSTIHSWIGKKQNALPVCARVGAYRIDLMELEKYLKRGTK